MGPSRGSEDPGRRFQNPDRAVGPRKLDDIVSLLPSSSCLGLPRLYTVGHIMQDSARCRVQGSIYTSGGSYLGMKWRLRRFKWMAVPGGGDWIPAFADMTVRGVRPPLQRNVPRQADMHNRAGDEIDCWSLQAAFSRREYTRAACTPTPLRSTTSASKVPVKAIFFFISHLLRFYFSALVEQPSFGGKPLWSSQCGMAGLLPCSGRHSGSPASRLCRPAGDDVSTIGASSHPSICNP